MIPLLAIVLALGGDPPPPEGPSISLELKLLSNPATKPAADPVLEKLMVNATDRRDEADTVKTMVIIHARGEVLVNPERVSLVLLEPSGSRTGGPKRYRVRGKCVDVKTLCRREDPEATEQKRVRLRSGEAISVRLAFDLGCYGLVRGDKVVLAAEFEDGGQPFQKPAPPEVTVAMRRVRSNSLVLTYQGGKP